MTQTQAVLDVTAQISNGTQKKLPLKLVASVVDANGKTVAGSEQAITLAPRDTAPYYLHVTVPQPHLWNGRKDPYLYQAVIELRTTDDVAVDRVEQPLGLRYYSIDPDKGFFLNGQPYHLHGVDRHQDFMNEGWAISDADMDDGHFAASRKSARRSFAARITSTAIIFTACATRPAFSSGRKFRRSTSSATRRNLKTPRATSCSI